MLSRASPPGRPTAPADRASPLCPCTTPVCPTTGPCALGRSSHTRIQPAAPGPARQLPPSPHVRVTRRDMQLQVLR